MKLTSKVKTKKPNNAAALFAVALALEEPIDVGGRKCSQPKKRARCGGEGVLYKRGDCSKDGGEDATLRAKIQYVFDQVQGVKEKSENLGKQ